MRVNDFCVFGDATCQEGKESWWGDVTCAWSDRGVWVNGQGPRSVDWLYVQTSFFTAKRFEFSIEDDLSFWRGSGEFGSLSGGVNLPSRIFMCGGRWKCGAEQVLRVAAFPPCNGISGHSDWWVITRTTFLTSGSLGSVPNET